MNMEQAVRTVLGKYFDFTGRARRSEFWFWVLATFLASIVAAIIDAVIGFQVVGFFVAIATIFPSLAVGARRLHDTGRSGWWQLLSLIPLIGLIVLIVFWAQDSQPDNAHGPSPKGGFDPGAPPAYGTPPTA